MSTSGADAGAGTPRCASRAASRVDHGQDHTRTTSRASPGGKGARGRGDVRGRPPRRGRSAARRSGARAAGSAVRHVRRDRGRVPGRLADVPAALPARRAAAGHAGRCCWSPTTCRSSTRSPAPGWSSTTAGCRTSWPRSRCSRAFAGTLLRSAGQIPVARFSADAHAALDAAKADLDAGNVVVIYPEGSVTRDPDWWPMQARTGVARLALTTDAVVLPVAQWGPQRVHDYHRKKLHLRFRAPADYLVGEPVDLSAAARARSGPARPLSAELLRETTDLIMTRVRDQLAELRQEPAPPTFHPRPRPRAARRRVGERRVTRAAVLGAGLVGHDVRQGARRRRLRGDAARPPPRAGQGDHRRRARTADYLPGIRLPVGGARHGRRRRRRWTTPTIVVLAVPSQSLRDNLDELGAAAARRRHPAVADEGHRARHHQADERGDLRGHRRRRRTGSPSLSGPNLAREIAEEQPAATVIACADADRAERAAGGLPHARTSGPTPTPTWSAASSAARSRTSSRWPAGIAEGLGFGDNTRASLITRGLAETARLGMALGAELTTFAGLAGLGDLVATCSSPLSRNRTFGEKLGQGMTRRGGAGEHPADRRGREELPVGARPGPRARRRRADHRGRRPGLPRGRVPGADGEGDHVARGEAGVSAPSWGDGTRSVRAAARPSAVPGAPLRPSPVFAAPFHLGDQPPRAGGADAYARTEHPTLRGLRVGGRRARRRPLPVLRHRHGRDQRRRARLRRAPATGWCCRRTATTRPGCWPATSWRASACAVDYVPTPEIEAVAAARRPGRRPAGAAGDAEQPAARRLRHRRGRPGGARGRRAASPSTTRPRPRSASARWSSAPTSPWAATPRR